MANNDYWGDDEIELATKAVLPRKRKPKDAQLLLPQALIESVASKAELREIATRDAYCLVIRAPSADWVHPIAKVMSDQGGWDRHIARSAPPRGRSDDAAEHLVDALTNGGRVFAVSHTSSLLPTAMLASADRTLVLPKITAEVIGKVIKQVTGSTPVAVPAHIGEILSFDELASCIRHQSTAAECVDRLRRAAENKKGVEVDDTVPFMEGLHGYDGGAREWALDLVEDLNAWRRGEIPFDALSRAVVLASPPGMGKTTMIKSLARSAALPLVVSSVAEWFNTGTGYLDSVVKQVDETFAKARALAPAIVFLDEIDAIPSRVTMSDKNADYWTVVITHILTLLDGAVAGTSENLIIVGATNHPERLDPALVRPGRLSRTVRIQPPDETALAGILRQHLGTDLLGVDLMGAARLALGSTGAMVVDLVKTARRSARRAQRPMEIADLIGAIAFFGRATER